MYADTLWGALQVTHGVISFCSDDVFLASLGVTQILQLVLGNESPGLEEHKMAVCVLLCVGSLG